MESSLKMAIRHPALRRHERETGLSVEGRNLDTDDNRKSANRRKMRLKVEMLYAGTEMSVVAGKPR